MVQGDWRRPCSTRMPGRFAPWPGTVDEKDAVLLKLQCRSQLRSDLIPGPGTLDVPGRPKKGKKNCRGKEHLNASPSPSSCLLQDHQDGELATGVPCCCVNPIPRLQAAIPQVCHSETLTWPGHGQPYPLGSPGPAASAFSQLLSSYSALGASCF